MVSLYPGSLQLLDVCPTARLWDVVEQDIFFIDKSAATVGSYFVNMEKNLRNVC